MDIIIGAGVTGLSYANFTKNDYVILEMDSEIGGYCKTIKQDGFIWDYSGHFFHFNDEKIKSYIFERMDKQEIFTVEKKTQIYYKDTYIDFPFQKNIHQLPKDEFIDCLYDLYHRPDVEENTFKDMLLSKFGQAISDKFLIPYNEKLYACDLDTLDKDAMGRFFPYADIEDIVENFKKQSVESYNSSFVYPEGGAIEYVKALAKEVADEKIILNNSVIGIDIENKIVTTTSGDTFSYDNLITTMPFNKLLQLVQLDNKIDVYTSNQVLVFNLGFDSGAPTENHWIYYPSKEYIFYRIGLYNNIFDSNRMSLYVEIGQQSGESIEDEEVLLSKVLADLKRVGIVTNQNLVSHAFLVMDPAYVH
ncbi:MAG TPA: LPS biosynthesis protein, partial [Flavobacteriaceae bacterium]|nr:LPS biosynthesis protein [Flavobacteriaceae bacterium]